MATSLIIYKAAAVTEREKWQPAIGTYLNCQAN